MINIRKVIKENTNEMVNNFKNIAKEKGMTVDETTENIFRMGISCGITLSSSILCNMPTDAVFEKDGDTEIKIPAGWPFSIQVYQSYLDLFKESK